MATSNWLKEAMALQREQDKAEDRALSQELKEIQAKNREWNKRFSKMGEIHDKGRQLEKDGSLVDAIKAYKKSIAYGIKYGFCFNNFARSIERIVILLAKTKNTKELQKYLEELIVTYPNKADDWRIRLAKINEKDSSQVGGFSYADIQKPLLNNNPIGKQYDRYKLCLQEFNFYSDPNITPESGHRFLSPEQGRTMREYREKFESMMNDGKLAEAAGDTKKAIELYYKLIAEEFHRKEPFERLITIYKRLKWIDAEMDILSMAINELTLRRDEQKEYVLGLARKYGKLSFAQSYIDQGKRIQYFNGVFDLYNPYPIIAKWEERLKKLQSK